MTEISYESVAQVAEAAELTRVASFDTVIDDGVESSEIYWAATLGDPVDSTIQVVGEDEETARHALLATAWEMVENRQVAALAAATPEDPPAEYSEEQHTGFSKEALVSGDPVAFKAENEDTQE